MTREYHRNYNIILKATGLALLLIGLIAIVCFLLLGETHMQNSGPIVTSDQSLVCVRHNTDYPFFDFDHSNYEETRIYIVFDNSQNISSISLRQTLVYSEESMVYKSEAFNHAAMNTEFTHSGFKDDAFGLNFSVQEDKLIMSLYSTGELFSTSGAKFFLLDDTADLSMSGIEQIYVNSGFECNR